MPERSRGRRAQPVDRGDDVHFENVLLLCWNVTVTTERSNENASTPPERLIVLGVQLARPSGPPFDPLGFSQVEDADASEGGQRLLK